MKNLTIVRTGGQRGLNFQHSEKHGWRKSEVGTRVWGTERQAGDLKWNLVLPESLGTTEEPHTSAFSNALSGSPVLLPLSPYWSSPLCLGALLWGEVMDFPLDLTLGFLRGLAWQKNKKSHRTTGAGASKKGRHARKTQ